MVACTCKSVRTGRFEDFMARFGVRTGVGDVLCWISMKRLNSVYKVC